MTGIHSFRFLNRFLKYELQIAFRQKVGACDLPFYTLAAALRPHLVQLQPSLYVEQTQGATPFTEQSLLVRPCLFLLCVVLRQYRLSCALLLHWPFACVSFEFFLWELDARVMGLCTLSWPVPKQSVLGFPAPPPHFKSLLSHPR